MEDELSVRTVRAQMLRDGYAELYGGPMDGQLIRDPKTPYYRLIGGEIYIRFENVKARHCVMPVTYIYHSVVENTPLKEYK